MHEPLRSVTNAIELKPGHKYLLVFKGSDVTPLQLADVVNAIAEMGVKNIGIVLDRGQEMQVIEVPPAENKENE